MNDISFSFVMPAYKKQFLYQAIDSILKQRYTNFELIIVNDASPENLNEVVSMFNDERIRYEVNEKNIGGQDLIANWNHCIDYAKNDYIILATDDDMFDSDFLSDAVHMIKKYPGVDLIRSGVKKIDEAGKTLDIEFPLKGHMTCREFTLFYAKGGTISCVSNYIFRKAALQGIGGFLSYPRGHYSDDATALALSLRDVACIPSNDVSFRVSGINLSNQSSIGITLDQINATKQFMEWFMDHVHKQDVTPGDFFERACYGGYKAQYMGMMTKLLGKFPLSKLFLVIKTIYKNEQLFKKDKLQLTANYFINKI